VSNRFDASLLFPLALLFHAAPLFFFPEAPLFGVAGGALGGGSGFGLGARAALFFRLFFLDAVLLEVHQFLEGEENRAFLLFGHWKLFPRSDGWLNAPRAPDHAGSIRVLV
jgi:hypothetical protein